MAVRCVSKGLMSHPPTYDKSFDENIVSVKVVEIFVCFQLQQLILTKQLGFVVSDISTGPFQIFGAIVDVLFPVSYSE